VIAAETLFLAATALVVGLGAAAAHPGHHEDNQFTVHSLVSDGFLPADHVDPNLVNAWGLVAGPTTPWWVANNGTDTSTLYDAAGNSFPLASPLVVHVDGGPTGLVFNGGAGFVVKGTGSGPARFIFASEDGKIRGWNPAADPTHALIGANPDDGAIFKGLAIASTSSGDMLYATDFHNGRVDVFDSSWTLVSNPGAFVVPHLPKQFAPFGIRTLDGKIFVTYAKQDENAEDDVHGPGLGLVAEFDTSGKFLGRVAVRGKLNAPWGLAIAPNGFGKFGGDLLVGNFGDGRINVFERRHDKGFDRYAWDRGRRHRHRTLFEFEGQLRTTHHEPITIDGLWGISFGNGATAGPAGTLFFTAGPDDENHGLFGKIEPSSD
jgi:uncharacterized protein (TIGR03118 family)